MSCPFFPSDGRSRYGLVLNVVVVVPLCLCLFLCNRGLGVVVIIVVVVPSPPCRRRGGVVVVIIATISSLPTFLVGCCVMGGATYCTSPLRASYAVVVVVRCRRCRFSLSFVVIVIRCCHSTLLYFFVAVVV